MAKKLAKEKLNLIPNYKELALRGNRVLDGGEADNVGVESPEIHQHLQAILRAHHILDGGDNVGLEGPEIHQHLQAILLV